MSDINLVFSVLANLLFSTTVSTSFFGFKQISKNGDWK